jgi:large subunit ribosomal protein L18
MADNQKRLRRARRTRAKIRDLAVDRLTIHRTPRHIYAQIIDATGSKVLVSVSTLDKDMKGSIKNGGNRDAAAVIGKAIAERAKSAGIEKVAFDRAGFKYHGRVQALADAAREAGLQF